MTAPNTELSGFLDRTGLSNKELARRIRAAAHACSQLHVQPDGTTVRRWLEGHRPRPPVPDLIADVLSTALGYRVTTYDIGFGDGSIAERGLTYSSGFVDTVEAVADLGRADVERRNFLAVAPFAAVAAVGPSRDWLLSTLESQPTPGGRVRLEDVTSVRSVFARFQHVDVMQGGGAGRHALARYMNDKVYPLLRRTHAEDVRQALCEATAEQTYLLGWMAYDNGEHGTAQRYLIQSLRLAQESRNAALGAHVLAGMADQATLLGNPAEGRSLAQAGRHGLTNSTSPACMADLWCLEARALARLGQKEAAKHAVEQSQESFARVRPEREPEWAQFIDVAYLHGEHAHTFRDLGEPHQAEVHARESIREAKRQQRARRGAMSQAALAAAHVQRRDLEAAHAAGLRAISLAKQVKSSRCTEAVRDLSRRMGTYGAHRLVTDYNDRARELTSRAA
ncbi:transcriptional regulator [Streptomyces sp. NPDC057702]|uniref:transcriptional regulator n=1 Tax=unclassified Streptomyces TaxID=2593676 RepID=UPI0036CAA8DE